MELSEATFRTAGILLLTIVAVESGGAFVLRLVLGKERATSFQTTFFRAGHAHAGVLVILSLVAQIYVDAANPSGALEPLARNAIPLAAILMPAGFFFSAMGDGRTTPNRWIVLIPLGAGSLAVGAFALGTVLLTS